MPAVTPAEVHTLPSRTKIGSGSNRTLGKRAANSAQRPQWVAARRPSSSPAVATRKAPLHTDSSPLLLKHYGDVAANDATTINVRQHIDGNEGLRTGTYAKTLTFTLSTTAP